MLLIRLTCLAVVTYCRGGLAFPTFQSLIDALEAPSRSLRLTSESSTHKENATVPTSVLFGRQDDIDDDGVFDQTDLSFITKMAAIGYSYSAGIGAGDRLGSVLDIFNPQSDYACSRYDHAFPYLVNQDARLGDPTKRTFQFKSCSGAITTDVINEQIPDIDANQQVILLSIGGNDVQLTNILNQCIFQWAVLNGEQVAVAKAVAIKEGIDWAQDFDWDATGRGCEAQLEHTQQLIDSETFSSNIDSVIRNAQKKLSSDGVIYYTGYAKFWAEDMSADCDAVSWTTWIYKAYNLFQPAHKLTTDHRKRMNELVEAVNAKLSAAAERAGSNVVFVDYDKYFGSFGGRFCEAGVDESTVESTTRVGLMFYELNSRDPLGSSPWKRSTEGPLNGTFEGALDQFAQITLLMDPNADFTNEDKIEPATQSVQAEAETKSSSSTHVLDIEVPNLLPDGYGRVFHPQILGHQIISNLVIYEMVNRNETAHALPYVPETLEINSCPYFPPDPNVLSYKGTDPGVAVKPGTELRILCVGDSITVGFLSDQNGGDGNGYRLQLRDDLSKDKVVFAGTESSGSMDDGYYAAWSGKTIQYISDHLDESLAQQPNIVLVAAGTNDMNANSAISTEGNNPAGAAERLGKLVDKVLDACPDAVVLVAMIIDTCDPQQSPRTQQFEALVPGVAKQRRDAGKHVLAVDFTTFPTSLLRDCIHPTNEGYHLFGDYWYDFVGQIPKDWINDPVGPDPDRSGGINDNEGIDHNIPPPDWGVSPIQTTSKQAVRDAADTAGNGRRRSCRTTPHWSGTGKIALGFGHNGAWHYEKQWVEAGQVASGLHRDPRYVRLQDMNGDGKADYVWLDPDTGMIICWINNLPDPWSPAGTNDSIIGSGAGRADTVYLADMNGDGMDDYMVVDPHNGAVRIWWNYGPDDNWVNGWKFVEGGQIATGVPHANLATLRFPDINGDGRADYVYIGEGGALGHWLNTGSAGGQDVLFVAQGGIATGAVSGISKLVFADLTGNKRDDYLIWDDIAGLTGFLNQPTQREGVPLYIIQGPPKTVADGITQSPDSIRLADLDGDGKDDYAYIDQNGAIWLWWNRGAADTSITIDGLRFADIDGDGLDDYVWLDAVSGAPTVFINKGPNDGDVLGWLWEPLNDAKPIASGAAPSSQVIFGDIDGDDLDDYLVLDPKTGAMTAYLNAGPDAGFANGWRWDPIGEIATGLGPGANVRIADIDGDGKDDYIYLHPNGGTTIYRNVFAPDTPLTDWQPMPEADASGIGQRPEEISFQDINGDGRADYVWTSALDGKVRIWFNDYPNLPTWLEQGEIAGGVGTSGACVRWAVLQDTGRASYVAVDPGTGAIAAWLNGCDSLGDPASGPVNLPPSDSTCFTLEDCSKWTCPKGQSMSCSAGNGGPFSGHCLCGSNLKVVQPHSNSTGGNRDVPPGLLNSTNDVLAREQIA